MEKSEKKRDSVTMMARTDDEARKIPLPYGGQLASHGEEVGAACAMARMTATKESHKTPVILGLHNVQCPSPYRTTHIYIHLTKHKQQRYISRHAAEVNSMSDRGGDDRVDEKIIPWMA